MTKPLEERLRFRILRAILFVSNISSLIVDLLILVGGKKFVSLIISVPDAENISLRIFAAIEAILCTIALFGVVLRHFYTFVTYCALLVLYLLCAAVFTRVPIVWFFLLGLILVILSFVFVFWLYQIKQRRRSNPYNI